MVGIESVDLGFHPYPLAYCQCTPAVACAVRTNCIKYFRQFDQACSRGIFNQLEYVHTTGQRFSPAQPQALQRHYQPLVCKPMDEALLTTIPASESSSVIMAFEEAKNILPRSCIRR
jgi:hypothetical protein